MPNPIQIILDPEQEKFIDAEVRSGRFDSAEHVVAEALSRLMQEPEEEIDEETYAALRRSDEQIARGEGRRWEDIREEIRSKYTRG
jgi:putative addiction module CopG family antidote